VRFKGIPVFHERGVVRLQTIDETATLTGFAMVVASSGQQAITYVFSLQCARRAPVPPFVKSVTKNSRCARCANYFGWVLA